MSPPVVLSRRRRIAAEKLLAGALDPAAEYQHQQGRDESEQGDRSEARSAGGAERGRDPDRRRRGEALDALAGLVMDDHSRAEEADAGDEPLDHAAQRLTAAV